MTLDEARACIGQRVSYTPAGQPPTFRNVERGVITSVNDEYVFVRYGAEWQSKATQPEDLVLP